MPGAETNAAERTRWNDGHWTAIWPRRERLTDPITPYLLAVADLHPGEAVVDVGCGGGKTVLAAAALVGADAGGRVVGADISEPLLELAGRRAEEAGLGGEVAFVHCDVQTEAVEGAPFDVAISQFGVMFFDEPVTAFANIAAQLRPGGRLVFACWQAAEHNPWYLGAVIAPFVPPPPAPAPGKSPTGPFVLADPGHVASVLLDAGFVHVARTPHELAVPVTLDAIVDDALLEHLGVGPADMDAARAAVDAHYRRFGDLAGDLEVPLAFQIVSAIRRPATRD